MNPNPTLQAQEFKIQNFTPGPEDPSQESKARFPIQQSNASDREPERALQEEGPFSAGKPNPEIQRQQSQTYNLSPGS